MLPVCADTPAWQYLHQTGHLGLLPLLYGRVVAPAAVVRELAVGRDRGVPLPDLNALPWVGMRVIERRVSLPEDIQLGEGEWEVLSLVAEGGARLAVLDDALARRCAQELDLPYTGTLGVLLEAKRCGHLPLLGPVLTSLDRLGFRLLARTRRDLLDLAGETPNVGAQD